MGLKTIFGIVWGGLTAISAVGLSVTYFKLTGSLFALFKTVADIWVPIPIIGMPLGFLVVWVGIGVLIGKLLSR